MRKQKAVADYPGEFFTAWELASANRLSLVFETKGKATNFKQRLYTFRRRLAEEAPAQASPFLDADIQVVEKPGGIWTLEAYVPAWKAALRAAESPVRGITGVLPEPEAEAPSGEALAGTLKGFGFGTEDSGE